MFEISETDAKEICALYGKNGVIAAAMELHCRYQAIKDHAQAIDFILQLIEQDASNSQTSAPARTLQNERAVTVSSGQA